MEFVVEVVRDTPVWVFLLLAFLIWQGLKARRVRTLPTWRPFIVPMTFLLMGIMVLIDGRSDGIAPLVSWLAAALVMTPFGLATGPRPLAWNPAAKQVTLAGSLIPLLRNLAAFSLQYGVAIELALHPDQHGLLAVVGRAVSGATAGYFIGWAIGLWRHVHEAEGHPINELVVTTPWCVEDAQDTSTSITRASQA
jgi:hypothetical protein